MSVYMEGFLFKWTNYYLGWQSRWFVLDDGVLSYYLTSNEVTQGSRGSVKVSSCNIVAHPKDPKRIDIIIKGERYIYLRASSPAERQKWLIGLGSAKQEASSPVHPSAVKSRIILLHTNCQLVVSQIAALKMAIAERETLSQSRLEELSSSLSTSCDAFLNTLAECMDLNYEDSTWPTNLKPLSTKAMGSPLMSHGQLSSQIFGGTSSLTRSGSNGFSEDKLYLSTSPLSTPVRNVAPPLSPTSPMQLSLPLHLQQSSSKKKGIHVKNEVIDMSDYAIDPKQHSESPDPIPHSKDPDPISHSESPDPIPHSKGPDPISHSGSPDLVLKSQKTHSRSNSDLFLTPTSSPVETPPPSPKTINDNPLDDEVSLIETFFSKLPHKFQDIKLKESQGIPTIDFLQSCRAALPFFDVLSPTAFSPVKQDINGNIEKLNKKYNENSDHYQTLQLIVLHELETGTHNARNSATDALLWLRRAMEFIQVFLSEVANGETSLDVAAGKAYGRTLRQHHNWIVRGIFNLAVKAVPYHDNFLRLLGSDGTVSGNDAVIKDMHQFSVSLNGLIIILRDFYLEHKLAV